MAGTFLLSLDCEGKWGVVDQLTPGCQHCYTTQRLDEAYKGVLSVLRKYEIGATFAFTAAFSMSQREFGRLRPQVESSGAAASPWMRQALDAIDQDEGEGWFAPSCFEAVKEAGMHEIASHGFSHLPWGAPYATRKLVDAELALNRQVDGFHAGSVETFVYPRNQVAHNDLLPIHGFRIFRAARRSFGRPANLLREFNLFSPSEQLAPMQSLPLAIPAGRFLNWRHGLRKRIPAELTVRRWEHIVRHAVLNGGVAHVWTHPEDFIVGDSMFSLLDDILRLAARERDAGRLRVLTCRELVRLSPSSQETAEEPSSAPHPNRTRV